MNSNSDINTCRLCLNEVEEYLQLSSGDPSFRVKLHLCIPNMDLDIVKVSVICAICAFELDTSYNLHTKCLDTEMKLQDCLVRYHLTHIDDLRIIPTREGINTKNAIEWAKAGMGDACTDLANSIEVKLEDVCGRLEWETEFDNVSREGDCEVCGITLHSKSELMRHARSCCTKNRYKCSRCSKSFSRQSSFRSHELLAHKQKIKKKADVTHELRSKFEEKCNICEKEFKTQISYKKHMKDHEEHQCEECGKVFRDNNTFKAHLKTHSKAVDFLCNICGMSFNLKMKLKSHMRKHSDEKPFKCKDCSAKFKHVSSLRVHRRTHAGDCNHEESLGEIFSCGICHQHFYDRNYLYKHSKIHGAKEFECETCKKRFSNKGDLGKHRRIHTGEKPYECKMCGMRFRLSAPLIRHTRAHTGEKPYVCETCGKCFNQKYNLNSHMRIHTGEKPYNCDTCNRKFSHKATLDSHIIKTHAGGEIFKCEVCFKCFSNDDTLDRHRYMHIKTEIKHTQKDFRDNEVVVMQDKSIAVVDNVIESKNINV